MPENAWLFPVLPLAAYVIIVFFGRRFGENASYIAAVGVGAAFVLAVANLAAVVGGARAAVSIPWLTIGDWEITMGYQVGPLEAVMLFMVTLVSWMVVIFSRGYMHGDDRFNRFFANVSLFIAAMLTLIIADNFLLFFAAWEIMGMCSYLLIGHWFRNLDNARAAMKAFLVTRLGDVGFMLGIWLIFTVTGSFKFEEVFPAIESGKIDPALLTFAALMLFAGAAGKSAQVPLHIWLPDAMAGPTPVSALIHAATMVAAGVFLVARTYVIFEAAPVAMAIVAFIGAITALMAALIATVQTDIKKVLAYSTISQLGFMMLGLGVGGFAAGIFHLNTHAFFKALLFLGAGSVIHAAHTQEMHSMGGLLRKLPVTGTTFIVGTLALAGVPPLAGFFSKDEILLEAYHSPYPVLFWLGVTASFLTAYYMTRAVVLTFFGKPRDEHVYEHAHESPPNMTLPLVVLGILAAVAGFAGAPFLNHAFQHFVAPHGHMPEPSAFVQATAVAVALGGIAAGWLIYGAGLVNRGRAIRTLYPLYTLCKQKFYFDYLALGLVGATMHLRTAVAFLDRVVIDGLLHGLVGLSMVLRSIVAFLDNLVVDRMFHALAGFALAVGSAFRKLAVGSVQAYTLVMFAGVVVGLLMAFLKLGG